MSRLPRIRWEGLAFEDRLVRWLPGDPSEENLSRPVFGAAWSPVEPTPVAAPRLLALSPEVALQLDLPEDFLRAPEFAQVFGGNALLEGMVPYAACYGGHQFGHWAGQLGDGRAIVLGERVNRRGERFELQLKGAGPTPYSRRADGRAVLRSSVREFLCSEAMAHLGVPTTRALCLVGTGEQVWRDLLYDGNPRQEPGAVVCRVAPSFLRFGNLQLPAQRGDLALLREIASFALATVVPEVAPGEDRPEPTPARLIHLLQEVTDRTADLMIAWARVGFVHGVMNTDNLSLLGLTLDYGPYGWLESYDPDWTPNTTDAERRRYRFGQQPAVALWNLLQLAEALYPLVGEVPPLQAVLDAYGPRLQRGMQAMLSAKLGLEQAGPLLEELSAVLRAEETDYLLFFRGLAQVDLARADQATEAELLAPLQASRYAPERPPPPGLAPFVRRWAAAARAEPGGDPREKMNAVNPLYVLRNWLAATVIERAEGGDLSGLEEALQVLRSPYVEQAGREVWAQRRPEWARHRPGCSMLSCSS